MDYKVKFEFEVFVSADSAISATTTAYEVLEKNINYGITSNCTSVSQYETNALVHNVTEFERIQQVKYRQLNLAPYGTPQDYDELIEILEALHPSTGSFKHKIDDLIEDLKLERDEIEGLNEEVEEK